MAVKPEIGYGISLGWLGKNESKNLFLEKPRLHLLIANIVEDLAKDVNWREFLHYYQNLNQ